MYDKINALLQQMDSVHDDIQTVATDIATLMTAQTDVVNKVNSNLDTLHSAFQGSPADAFFVSRDNAVAKAQVMLDSLGQLHQSLISWNQSLQNARDSHHRAIFNAMGWLPTELWDLLDWYYEPGSLRDIHQNGPGNNGGIGWAWDDRVAPFIDPTNTNATGMSDQELMRDFAHRGHVSRLVDYVNGLLQQGYSIGGLHDTIWQVDYLLYQLYCDIAGLTNAQLASAYTLPDICHIADAPPKAAPATQPTLTPAQVQQTIAYIHNNSTSAGAVAEYLANSHLNDADRAAIAKAFQQKYGQDLANYIWTMTDGKPQYTYQLMQLLFPQNVQAQQFVNSTQAGPNHVILSPTLAQVGVVPPGTSVPYQLWLQQGGKVDEHPLIFAYPQGGNPNDPRDYISPLQLASSGFPHPGTYTVVMEIPPSVGHPSPRYITFTQKVVSADKLDPVLLAMMNGGGAQGGGSPWPSASDYLKSVQKNMPDCYGDASSKLSGDFYPVPALYIPSSGQTQYVPMSIFAKRNSDGSYTIVDATNPHDIRVYTNSSFGAAWHDFIQNNQLPDGQISAIAPNIPGQHITFPAVDGTPPNAQMWNAPNNDHSFAYNAQHALNVLSTIATVVGFFFPPAFIVAGAAGAISGGMQIWDQVQHGDWKWDWQHGLEIAGVVMNAGFVGEGVAALSKFAAARMADGAVQIQLEGVAKTSEIAGKWVVNGSMVSMGIMITGSAAQQAWTIIQKDEAAGKSNDQIWQDLQPVLGQAGAQLTLTVGLPFLSSVGAAGLKMLADKFGIDSKALTAFFQRVEDGTASDDEMQKWADRMGVSTDLLKQIAQDPTLQAAMLQGGPQAMKDLYAQYQRDVLPQVEAGDSQQTFAEYLFTPMKSGELPNICRYQKYQLDTLLNSPNDIPNQADLSQSQMRQFTTELRGNPKMQLALVGDNSFNLKKLEEEFKAWRQSGGVNSSSVADRDFYMYLSRHDGISTDLGVGTNCGLTAAQYDATMGGEASKNIQLGEGYTSLSDLATAMGKSPSDWVYVDNAQDLQTMMLEKGPGSRAIVFGSRGPGEVGHYFNVINDDGTIEILDAQTHQPVDLKEFHDFSVLQTADGVPVATPTLTPEEMQRLQELRLRRLEAMDGDLTPHIDEVGGTGSTYDPNLVQDLLSRGFSQGEVTVLEANLSATQAQDVIKFLDNSSSRFTPTERLQQMQQFVQDFSFTSRNPDPAIAAREEAGTQYALKIFMDHALSDCDSYETYRAVQTPYGRVRSKPDFTTSQFTYEITVQDTGKVDQVLRDITTEPINPATGKKNPIILVAPNYSDQAMKTLLQRAQAQDPGAVVYVVRNYHDVQSTLNMTSVANTNSAEQNLAQLLATLAP